MSLYTGQNILKCTTHLLILLHSKCWNCRNLADSRNELHNFSSNAAF